MMQSIQVKGGARDVRNQGSFSAEHHVLSNAFLPGMFRGRGVRLFLRAPSDKGKRLIFLLLPTVICPGAFRKSARFFIAGNSADSHAANNKNKEKGDCDHEQLQV
jgi:hypothetical protein